MMMISPELYADNLKDRPYTDLIRIRDNLIRVIRKFERNEMKGDRSDPSWQVCPGPDVVYQMNLEYLAALCRLMQERYNEEFVWGEEPPEEDDGDEI